MTAYIFPGQGSQFPGMGHDLYTTNPQAAELFEQANQILGFRITDTLFNGTEEALRQTNVTQPAIFLHSVIKALVLSETDATMGAGHSLGEFSALVVAGALSFEDGLRLVAARADAMQEACLANPGTMAAVLGLDDEAVERICAGITDEIVVPANYNCPGQLVISGSVAGIERACLLMKEGGAKRALPLPVGGAFHSPLMEPARIKLEAAIAATPFSRPRYPVYQNATALPAQDPELIKTNLIAQLTAPVRWTQSVRLMATDGAARFVECGPGNVLQGLVKKIVKEVETGAL